MLELIDIHTYYGNVHILYGISLKVERGATVALLGRNGMGKTTTLRSIIGLTPPRSGTIRFMGRDITGLRSYQIAQMGIGLVPQGRRIFPSLSVKENLTTPARTRGEHEAWSLDRTYSLFPILKERDKLRGTLLSGGEQQMLCIGRALMTNPDLLLMDEPSEGLAPKVISDVSNIIKKLHRDGLSILLVEQNLHLALEVADYIYVISKGTIVYKSTPEELRDNEEVITGALGVARM